MRGFLLLLVFTCAWPCLSAAQDQPAPPAPAKRFIRLFRPAPPLADAKIEYDDLDKDGDPDVLRTTSNGFPIQWIDDDDDMRPGDWEGDADSDCIMIDRNRDGKYGAQDDFIVDWGDEDGDGKADIQVVAENSKLSSTRTGPGHYMIVVDTDKDGVFNYVDWSTMHLLCWEHSGSSRFYEDYLGNSLFLKMHASTFAIRNLSLNWENPFLFYDTDKDGLTEWVIRLCDGYQVHPEPWTGFSFPEDGVVPDSQRRVEFSGKINLAQISFDLDNDNAPGNEFDYDMSLGFYGPGFDYTDQVHKFKSLKGLPEADKLFYDPRFRHLDQLVYADHASAWNLVFNRGKWSSMKFIFDEDDDNNRWERVDFLEPKDPFIIGSRTEGIDWNPQTDCSGDRGEFDADFSGKARLYIGGFDGRIHLYGAEWGVWRIDQDARYNQGWSRSKDQPTEWATIKYTDTNNNGFLDTIEYDMDGDHTFERKASLIELGIDDTCKTTDTSKMVYGDFQMLYKKMAKAQWENALDGVAAARKMGLVTDHYAPIMRPASVREQEHFGFWLSYYIHEDLSSIAERRKDAGLRKDIDKAYYSGNWKLLSNGGSKGK